MFAVCLFVYHYQRPNFYISNTIVTTAAALRQQSITPNRSSFEAGSAEHNFARDTHIPPENDVNALFNRMLVSQRNEPFMYYAHLSNKFFSYTIRNDVEFTTKRQSRVWITGEWKRNGS